MSRELHPKLFQGEQGMVGLQLETPVVAPSPADLAQGYLTQDVKALSARVNEMRVQVQAMEKHSEKLAQNLQEFVKHAQVRFERFSQALVRLEENQSSIQQDGNQKIGVLASRLAERRVNDNKLAELMERHHMMVQNFENRLTSLQRVVNEQELQLHNAHAALDEARQELSRLRRG